MDSINNEMVREVIRLAQVANPPRNDSSIANSRVEITLSALEMRPNEAETELYNYLTQLNSVRTETNSKQLQVLWALFSIGQDHGNVSDWQGYLSDANVRFDLVDHLAAKVRLVEYLTRGLEIIS